MTEELGTEAWLIHQYPIRDHLLLVYMLTPDRLIKGFYRVPKKPYVVKPQAFYPYWISWKQNKQAINIQRMEAHRPGLTLQGLKLFVGLYLNELIFNLCRDEALVPGFYSLYQHILYDETPCDELLLRQFEWQLLADCGYAIDFSCTHQQQSIQANLHYQFNPNDGFMLSHDGISGQQLLAIEQGELETPATMQVLKKILRQTIEHVLDGRVLHSRNLLKEWLLSQS